MRLTVDWKERAGFRYGHSSCLRRCQRKILFRDFPILRRLRPILGGFHNLDKIAFAAELIELGYCTAVVARASECAEITVARLRERMLEIGIAIAPRVPLVRKPHGATFTAEHQPKQAASGVKGVYWDKQNKRWAVQRRVKGKTYRFGMYERLEDAAARSAEVQAMEIPCHS